MSIEVSLDSGVSNTKCCVHAERQTKTTEQNIFFDTTRKRMTLRPTRLNTKGDDWYQVSL